MSPSSDVENLVRAGIEAARAGKREEAYELLIKAIELDETNETAWLWLSGLVDSPEDQQTCLENVLTINPHNEKALRGLEMLRAKSQSTAKPSSPPKQSSASASGIPPATSAPFSASISGDEDELPTNVAWDMPIPSSSPSQVVQVEEPTPDEYDDWVTGLNLKPAARSGNDLPAAATPLSTMPFVADESLFGFADEEEESFTAPRDKRGDDDADILATLRADVYAEGPFEAELEEDDILPPAEPEPRRAPAETFTPRPAAPPPAAMSGAYKGDKVDKLDVLPPLDTEDVRVPELLDNYDEAEIADLSPEEYFAFIPAEIKASRLPGTVERHPLPLLLALLALFSLNIGALLLVVNTLSGG